MSTAVSTSSGTQPDLELDVAIIGGGVAGLYTGWRLLTGVAQPGVPSTSRVHVFELADRIGGRLETVFFDGMSGLRAEFGGMRYTDQHILVSSLIAQLGLTPTPFPMGGQQNLWFLRGRRLQAGDFSDPANVPYNLRACEKGKSIDQLMRDVLVAVLSENGIDTLPSSRQQWDALKPQLTHRGQPIYTFGWWNVLSDYLSGEAYQLITDGGGYYTSTMNWSAGEAMEFLALDFVPQPTYLTLKEGYDAIPIRLAQQFTSAGGAIWAGNGLLRFEHSNTPGKPPLKLTIQNQASGTAWDVYAHQIVLALPQRSLELLQLGGSFFDFDPEANPHLNSLVYAVTPQPALKLFMGYDWPWWNVAPLNLMSGRSITDLPLRQTYYFGTASDSQRSLLMTSYDDGNAASFWEGLAWSATEQTHAPRYAARNEGGKGDVYAAPPRMVASAQQLLRRIHGLPYIPDPYVAAYRDWSADPYGGGWHLWNTQVAVWDAMAQIRKPLPTENVYICGEAYSGLQGWVEGALTTSERLLQTYLGLQPPIDWLPSSYYLGY